MVREGQYYPLMFWLRLTCLLPLSLLLLAPLWGQDSTQVLDEVRVQAYGLPSSGLRAAVERIATASGEQYAPASAVPLVNALAGVRLDERSPGSYRLSIRGSALRAPFGVRNVKIYMDGIPFTDPGGVSYLNQLGPLQFAGATVLKGPGSSMYGAGTGGVMLLEPAAADTTGGAAGYSYGSYQQHTILADLRWHTRLDQAVAYQQVSGQGYRDQSALDRKLLSWSGRYRISDRQELSAVLLLGRLHYETPGALTLEEYEHDPAASRAAGNGFPSAAGAGAAIDQRMAWLGIGFRTDMGRGLHQQTGIGLAYTELRNPAIRNYAVTTQPQVSIRSAFAYEKQLNGIGLRINAGIEGQTGWSRVQVYTNNEGQKGVQQSKERIVPAQGIVFLQSALSYNNWELILGASLNGSSFRYEQVFPQTTGVLGRSLAPQLVPRIVLSRALGRRAFLYASFSKGFSPPVADELLPSGSAFNRNLQPEIGQNYELGFRCRPWPGLQAAVNAYYFLLRNTIVQRRDAGGGDYYVNAGQTRQPGIEASLSYEGGRPGRYAWSLRGSYAFQPYRYADFIRGQDDYSGKALPGLAEHNLYAGIQLTFLDHILVAMHDYYSGAVPLNDANSAYGGPVHLVTGKAGYQWQRGMYRLAAFIGVDNLLDRRYSLGYDINAAGSRYYNAAPPRNYYFQLLFSL
ncbi:TonB-dependent receptor [Taibaiella koreensis]|uniref:TonB-dependent receptor n=1 Tax=Taibaiella koreensis TaxID=1268548 RepID=UPI000E599AC7|nr:TonB-dependent receptor [Taibaiella koreensis]